MIQKLFPTNPNKIHITSEKQHPTHSFCIEVKGYL